jgi:hypothetical protein
MNLYYSFVNNSNVITAIYTVIFYLFVTPYSIGINNQGVSGNYFFLLLPLFVILIKREIVWPPKSVILFMILLTVIFLVGSITQAEQYDFLFRRSASFIVFMAIFALMFIKIDLKMINAFKNAIVIWSLLDGLIAIIEYITLDGNSSGVYGKGIFGTQRVGFVYLMGFWIVTIKNPSTIILKATKFIVAYIIIVGLFLTYTRTSILGFSASTGAYFLYIVINNYKKNLPSTVSFKKIFYKFSFIFMQLILVALIFSGSVKYYSNAIFGYIFSTYDEYVENDELNLYTSWTVYFENNKKNNQTSFSRMKDTVRDSQQEEFMVNIIERVSSSKEINEAQKEINDANNQLDSAIKLHNNIKLELAIALEEKNKANKSNDYIEITKKNDIYQGYVTEEIEITQIVEDKKNKLKNAQSQKIFTTNRLLTIELQLLVVDLKRQAEDSNDKEITQSIAKKINDAENKIAILANQSILSESNSQNENTVLMRMKDKGTSIGYRVYMHKIVFDEIYKSPWIGSAFLGVWTLFDNREGSAHSQYLDILFRVGIVAFLIYLSYVFKVTLFLFKNDLGLFFGFIGFLFFGLFHETIKLSQGGFIFAFLFAMWAQQNKHLIGSTRSEM